MKVGAGGSTRRADVTDHLAFADGGSGTDPVGELFKMRVTRCIRGVVLDLDRFTVRTAPVGKRNHTVTHGANRRAALCREVDPSVRQIDLAKRVETSMRKVRGDTGKLERKTQERASQASSIQAVVVTLSLLLFEI